MSAFKNNEEECSWLFNLILNQNSQIWGKSSQHVQKKLVKIHDKTRNVRKIMMLQNVIKLIIYINLLKIIKKKIIIVQDIY